MAKSKRKRRDHGLKVAETGAFVEDRDPADAARDKARAAAMAGRQAVCIDPTPRTWGDMLADMADRDAGGIVEMAAFVRRLVVELQAGDGAGFTDEINAVDTALNVCLNLLAKGQAEAAAYRAFLAGVYWQRASLRPAENMAQRGVKNKRSTDNAEDVKTKKLKTQWEKMRANVKRLIKENNKGNRYFSKTQAMNETAAQYDVAPRTVSNHCKDIPAPTRKKKKH